MDDEPERPAVFGPGGCMDLYRYHVWCPDARVRLKQLPFWTTDTSDSSLGELN